MKTLFILAIIFIACITVGIAILLYLYTNMVVAIIVMFYLGMVFDITMNWLIKIKKELYKTDNHEHN